ncbi:MAG: hypothetical protein AAF404_06065, partial [Pseudomonadota bacterium]
DVLSRSDFVHLQHHPHCFGKFSGQNTMYVGRQRLSLMNNVAGAGTFALASRQRTLTATGCNRSMWCVPDWMHPRGRRSTLSYHHDTRRWRRQAGQTLLQSVARGQEFVLDTDHYPEALDWVVELLSESI